MADRKARTIVVKLPITATIVDLKKALDKESVRANPTVIQDLGAGQYLVEFDSKEQAEAFIDGGLDFDEIHIECRPPSGYYINVSILGLRAYVSDEAVISVLEEFGEIKSDVIRLKYKSDHDFAGIENGNRLVKMVLTKPSIPYSLRIDGEWCRILHNDQQRVCSNCHALGHSRRKCPEITCRVCGEKGHLSYDCPQEFQEPRAQPEDTHEDNNTVPDDNAEHNTSTNDVEITETPPQDPDPPLPPTVTDETSSENENTAASAEISPTVMEHTPIDFLRPGLKRQLPTDSDSDTTKPQPQRRPRIKQTPNVSTARNRKANKGTSDNPTE